MNHITKNGMPLYEDMGKCCGCGACSLVCPTHAITMKADDKGASYPDIDLEKCIACNRCIKTCAFGQGKQDDGVISYAAANNHAEQSMASSSGGVFPAIATDFLRQGHAVVGVALDIVEGRANVRHIMIQSQNELTRLQGSKYVQSSGLENYNAINQVLKDGKKLLFSGTPCQVAGFKSLFKQYLDQIYAIDIICHGVPGLTFFNDYLDWVHQNQGGVVTGVVFRDKALGWSTSGRIDARIHGDNRRVQFSQNTSSYYSFFYSGETYRDSCYACPYACLQRVGDLTIGDYWGVQRLSPELMVENGGPFDSHKGISCVLCNNAKGADMLQKAKDILICREVTIDKITVYNHQLVAPANHTALRHKLFRQYHKKGYSGVEKIFCTIKRKEAMRKKVKAMIPRQVYALIKKVKK